MYLQKCAQFNSESGGEGIALMVHEDRDEKRVVFFFTPIIYFTHRNNNTIINWRRSTMEKAVNFKRARHLMKGKGSNQLADRQS